MENFLKKGNNWIKSKLKKHKYYVSICCIQKDENEYLTEWIDYHLKIGVEHFYIYDNGSLVHPSTILNQYIVRGLVTIIDFPGSERQNEAYMHCIKSNRTTSKWIACIDVDEFIVPKNSKTNLKELLKNYERFGALGVNWLIFGSSGHKRRTNQSQLKSFIMRSHEDFGVNTHIKSIVQPYYVKHIGSPHHFIYRQNKYCVNENFVKIEGPFSPHSSSKIQLNHYYCRSEEEYYDKIKRGYADHIEQREITQFLAHDKDSNYVKDENALMISQKID